MTDIFYNSLWMTELVVAIIIGNIVKKGIVDVVNGKFSIKIHPHKKFISFSFENQIMHKRQLK